MSPSITGIVAGRDGRSEGVHVRLDDGTTLLIANSADDVYGGPVTEGDLLIYAADPLPGFSDGPWYVSISAFPSGCFYLPANGEVRGDRMALSYGFSLPLSDEWEETETRFVRDPSVGFCLNESGSVNRPY